MEIELQNQSSYFSNDMTQEYHVAFAKREASRIVRYIEYHKKAALLEKHVDLKYKRSLVGS